MNLSQAKHTVKRELLGVDATRATLAAFAYDARRYLAHSSTRGPHGSRENLAAKLIARYHAVEKGLAMPDPRPGFGRSVIPVVVSLTSTYLDRYGPDQVTRAACGALSAYLDFNTHHGLSAGEIPAHDATVTLLARAEANPPGVSGTTRMRRDDILSAVGGAGLDFFTSRHSTRVFSEEPVSDGQIEFAVRAARSAPAVCNREFGQVTVWTDPDRIKEILAVQGGARGFGHQVPGLGMVTVTQRAYWTQEERNQGWIDGGSFAMAFMLGLHAQGLGAVALNWSKSPATDRRMRVTTGLAEDRSIIMFVGFGHLRDEYDVAASDRAPLDHFWVRGT